MNILVAEDEIGISNFLKQGLEEENYTVPLFLMRYSKSENSFCVR